MQGWMRTLLVLMGIAAMNAGVHASQPAHQSSSQDACCHSRAFPDEYSVLEQPSPTATSSDVTEQLERARQYYLRGLATIERRDTARAAKLFEAAMDVLNQLASTPGIDRNEDYADLAQSIIEDYENFVRPIDELEASSPLFVMRDRLFQAVEVVQSPSPGAYQPVSGTLSTTVSLVYNEQVANAIAFLTNTERGRAFFKRILARMNRFFPMFRRIAREEGVPEELIYLAIIESGLDPNAVSRARAVGLWQFIQSTGELYQLRVTQWYDERRDPEKSTRAAMRHLRDLYQELGNWHLALAAYNCGINCVRRAIKQLGLESPNFWQLRDYLPRETRNYVPLYIAATLVALQAEAYGFRKEEITPEPEWLYDTVTVSEPVVLSALAQCAGTTLDTLKALNPELVRNVTPPDQAYALRIPPGRTQEFAVRFALLQPEEKQPWIVHRVMRGETLVQLAQRYSVDVDELAQANGLSRRSRLRRGQVLRIPLAPPEQQPLQTATQQQTSDSAVTVVAASEPTASAPTTLPPQSSLAAEKERTVAKPTYTTHRVQRGETLAQIADDYGTTVAALRQINGLRSWRLKVGQMLKVPQQERSQSTQLASSMLPPAARKVSHKVRRGENISTIAALYGVREAELVRWNPALRTGVVKAGQKLTLYVEPQGKGSARATPPNVNRMPKWYTVRPGDTMYSIARRFGVELSTLLLKNKMTDPHLLRVGQRLRLQ